MILIFQKFISLFKYNFAIIISGISFLLSLYNFFYSKYVNRKKINIELLTYRIIKIKESYIYQFKISFTNCSRLPISITNIAINNNVFCAYGPHLIKVEKIPLVAKESRIEETSTIQFPINLSQLEGKTGYLEFKIPNKLNIENIILNIYTNRGTLKNNKPIIQSIKKDSDTPYCLWFSYIVAILNSIDMPAIIIATLSCIFI